MLPLSRHSGLCANERSCELGWRTAVPASPGGCKRPEPRSLRGKKKKRGDGSMYSDSTQSRPHKKILGACDQYLPVRPGKEWWFDSECALPQLSANLLLVAARETGRRGRVLTSLRGACHSISMGVRGPTTARRKVVKTDRCLLAMRMESPGMSRVSIRLGMTVEHIYIKSSPYTSTLDTRLHNQFSAFPDMYICPCASSKLLQTQSPYQQTHVACPVHFLRNYGPSPARAVPEKDFTKMESL